MPFTAMTHFEELRSISQSIASSYENKVRTVISLMREVENNIVESYEEQKSTIGGIGDLLARTQNLRKHDFNELMNPIVDLQNYWKERIHNLLEQFFQEEEGNISSLKSILEGTSSSSVDDFYVLKDKILSRPKDREVELSELLRRFHQDQAELGRLLRRLLKKGNSIRLKDLKQAIRAFQADHCEDGIQIDEILREFSKVKEEISYQWDPVVNTVDSRKFATVSTDECD